MRWVLPDHITCEAARSCNVSVEAEIGHVLGHEGNMLDGNSADPSLSR